MDGESGFLTSSSAEDYSTALQKLMESIYSQLQAIEMCIEKRFIDSALVLIYSGIDNLAYIEMKDSLYMFA